MAEPPREDARFYIDEHIRVYEGREAAERLRARSDLARLDPATGVTRVDEERWQEAQRYERRTWLERGRLVLSDRNEYHRERFAGYAPLRGRSFRRAIELGCGPFTNMRLILEHCRAERIHLLDPLIEDYLRHPACRYRGGRLGGLAQLRPAQLPAAARRPLGFLAAAANAVRVGGLRGRPVVLEPAPIEGFQTDHRFDLVVMINVLEHCRDAGAVLDKILQISAPGGVFVFHDVLYDAEELRRTLSTSYDAGHPLRVAQPVLREFLGRHFEPLMSAEYRVAQTFRGAVLDRRELYYIGVRRAAGAAEER